MVRAFPLRARSLPALAGAAVLLSASCTGDDAGIHRLPLAPDASPAVLTVSPKNVTLAWIGAKAQLTAQVSTAGGTAVQGLSYSWTTLNHDIVAVDQEGRIVGLKEGEGKVVVRVMNLADTANVLVTRLPATIVVNPDTVLFTELEASVQISATVFDGGEQVLESAEVTWSSGDTTVAVVDAEGTVTSVGQGLTTITVRSGAALETVQVRVAVGPSSVAVEPTSLTFTALGDTARIAAAVLDARGDTLPDVAIVFTSSDSTVASVDSTGLVSAVSSGSATILATGDTVAAAVSVAVTQEPATVTVSPDSVTLIPGGTQAFTVSVLDANAVVIASPAVTWTIADTTVATVDATGLVTGVGAGSTDLIATSGSVADTAVVNVLDVPVDSVDITPDSVAMDPGAAVQLSISFFAADGTVLVGPTATWTSRNDSVATVDATGLVTALMQGSTWIVATADSASDSTYVAVNAPPGLFDIEVRYVGTTPSLAQQAAFAAAESRWENAIIGELPNGTVTLADSACGIGHPAVSESVDDLLIFAEVTTIDGVGGVLAQAGPCLVRTSGGLAIVGTMQFDEADLDALEASGDLQETVIHEMGHVLSFGTESPWTDVLVGAGGSDPYWPGTQAVAEYDAAGGTATNKVPVENTGGTGTQDAHWRESDMGRELMTGYLNSGVDNPLSAITIGAMQDMGYTVDLTAAEAYTVSASWRAAADRLIRIEDRVLAPLFGLDPSGKIVPLAPR
ncbi:MAG: Ig-like domain-containing protein [Gemmatimonadota bacterium]